MGLGGPTDSDFALQTLKLGHSNAEEAPPIISKHTQCNGRLNNKHYINEGVVYGKRGVGKATVVLFHQRGGLK